MKPGSRSKVIIVFESTIKIMITTAHTEKVIGKIFDWARRMADGLKRIFLSL